MISSTSIGYEPWQMNLAILTSSLEKKERLKATVALLGTFLRSIHHGFFPCQKQVAQTKAGLIVFLFNSLKDGYSHEVAEKYQNATEMITFFSAEIG